MKNGNILNVENQSLYILQLSCSLKTKCLDVVLPQVEYYVSYTMCLTTSGLLLMEANILLQAVLFVTTNSIFFMKQILQFLIHLQSHGPSGLWYHFFRYIYVQLFVEKVY